MQLEPLGERAYIVRDLGSIPADELARALNASRMEGVIEANGCYDTVGVYLNGPIRELELLTWIKSVPVPRAAHRKQHTIPVCYALGEDIEEASAMLGISTKELIEAHTSQVYRCFAIGFSPGFPYCGHLTDRIAGLPRRETPRTRVPEGAVAIAGRQTAVYPQSTPGGWWLIGQTPLVIADLQQEFFPIQAGDSVRFVAIDNREFSLRKGERL